MRHHDEGSRPARSLLKDKLHDFASGATIEAASRFIGQDQGWIRYQRTANGRALSLALR